MSNNNDFNGDKDIAAGIARSAANRKPSKGEQYQHKYRWSGEEKGTVLVTAAIAVGAGVKAFIPEFGIGWLILGAVFAAFSIFAGYLGASRKNKSKLIAVYDPESTVLTVEGNGFDVQSNRGRLDSITDAFVKKISRDKETVSPKDQVIISFKTGPKLYIPMRLVANPNIMALIESPVKAQASKKAEMDAFFEAAADYKG